MLEPRRGSWVSLARLVGFWLMSIHGLGCDEAQPGTGHAPAGTIDDAEVAFDEVKRPARTVYAGNDGGRCEVFWERGERRSVGATIRCPRELEPGERLRLAGSGCIRESPKPERAVPVRCVKPMLYVRDAERSGGKEYPEFHLKERP